ncbi:hypothetical protein ATCC90586_001042 [Pythium insidiosum]|nr:hypothetical protein ATCC90586_001042 [Pythium insidiosum]
MGTRKKDRPAPQVGKPKKPLAPQVKQTKTGKLKRAAAETIVRPWTLPQFEELPKEERDIIVDRVKKEIVDSLAVHPNMRKYVARGVNHVSRLITKRELRVVVFACNPDTSVGAFGHIPVLCRLHRVPICVLRLSSKMLGSTFNMPSLAVFGLRHALAPQTTSTDDATEPVPPASQLPVLSELEQEKLSSITSFLISKASKKNHALV